MPTGLLERYTNQMAINPDDLRIPSAYDLAQEDLPAEDGDTKPHPMDEREYEFTLNFVDRRKKKWYGVFRTQILSIRQERTRGIFAAKMAGGVPFEALDPSTRGINYMLAHMALCLTAKPAWAEKIEELVELDVLEAIYAEVQAHVAHYFRLVLDPEEGNRSQ